MPDRLHIGVFCGSSARVPAALLQPAQQLGELIGARGHTLVWGGGGSGLMGAVARAAREHGARLVGVIPGFMMDCECVLDGIDELIEAPDMRQRKAVMEERADAFVVLPGGPGTLDELFEVLALGLVEQLRKPTVLLNHAGFYDGLLAFLEHLHATGFARPRLRELYQVAPDARMAMDQVERRCGCRVADGPRRAEGGAPAGR